MTRFHLVRHGRATGGWDDDLDPGIDELGIAQAARACERLAPLGPLPIVSSPLRRCQETARPLADVWGVTPEIVHAVTEIPSPAGIPLGERVPWLREAMAGTWSALGPDYVAFRDGVIAALAARHTDTVVFSHFIAINAVIGVALGDDRLVIRSLDNCSITVVEVMGDPTDGGTGRPRVTLIEGGHEADTLIR